MVDFTFRFPFRLPISRSITIQDNLITLDSHGFSVELKSESKEAIKDSKDFLVKGSGFATEEGAFEAGEEIRNALIRTFVNCKIGADFGDDSQRTFITKYYSEKMYKEHGVHLLGYINGLMVYPTFEKTEVLKINGALGKQISKDQFVSVFEEISKTDCSLSVKEKISYDLYSSSFFTTSGYARLLFLVMAIEVLLEPTPRSSGAINLITSFINAVRSSEVLDNQDKDSLVGGLTFLLNKSIRQCARIFIDSRLGDKNYDGLTAFQLFQNCYTLRSSIVHGKESFPDERAVDNAAAQLEPMVADLISDCVSISSI